MNDRRAEGDVELRADFSNDRHFAVRVLAPYDGAAVATALHRLAVLIGSDLHLRERRVT